MKLNEEEILKRANDLYVGEKYAKHVRACTDAEIRPTNFEVFWEREQIQSRQVKCLLKAIVEAINAQD